MSSANLDLVRSIFADWERGDYGSAEWAHPEIEFERRDGLDFALSVHGVAAMALAWREFVAGWADVCTTADEYRELDSERVLVLSQYSGRGKTSGIEIAQLPTKGTALFQMQAGKVTRLTLWRDRDRALADLGLAPEGE
jgi:hypothetical protein